MLTGWFQCGAAPKVEVAQPLLSPRKIPPDLFYPGANRISFAMLAA
jgi:hypothetical protein